ncbi:MAG TPA: hypothetical protein HPQ03_13215 [Deltaproteobacteria bacterium]|nr:hypothetical protein [Deltaproteobacteria bacterium]
MEDKKKRVAAVSAVMEYIRKEEDKLRAAPSPAEVSNSNNLWGISGRQAQMQLRNMMQLKAFHGVKVR